MIQFTKGRAVLGGDLDQQGGEWIIHASDIGGVFEKSPLAAAAAARITTRGVETDLRQGDDF